MIPRPRPCALLPALLAGALLLAPDARSAEADTYRLTIKDHRFAPAALEIPAGRKVALVVGNLDPTAEEFESSELHRESVVPGGAEITLYIGPLQPGRYRFFGDFNRASARGEIVAK